MEAKLFFVIVLVHFNALHAINENCTVDTDCTASEKSVCNNQTSTCTCDTLYFFSSDANKCLKYATEFGSICSDVSQCSPFLGDNSACTNNVCVCEDGFKWYQGKCQQYAGKDEECSTKKICLDHINPLSLQCSADTNICVCADDYYDRGGDCRKKAEINEDCAITMDCTSTTKDTYCGLGKCIKNSSTASKLHKEITDPVMDDDNDVDDDDSKCSAGVSTNLNEAECSECSNTQYFNKEACICAQGFFLSDAKCIAELGMKDDSVQYQNDSDCPIKPGKLGSDGICYCKEYWFQDETNRECKKTTLEYTKNCMDNDWCKAMGPYAFCNSTTEKCECSSIAELNEASFYCEKVDTDISDVCLSDWECALYETCKDEKCQCDEGFYKVDEDGLCLPKIGYSCEVRDCDHIEGGTCNATADVCACANATYVNDGYQCLPETTALNKECIIQEQCQNIPNSACLADASKNATTKCLCNDEYLNVNGKCFLIRSPGSLCSTLTDCTAILGETFVCRNMLCQCPIGKSLNERNVCVTSGTEKVELSKILLFTLVLYRVIKFGW